MITRLGSIGVDHFSRLGRSGIFLLRSIRNLLTFTGYGAKGISRAATQAVVTSSILILIWDFVVTSFVF